MISCFMLIGEHAITETLRQYIEKFPITKCCGQNVPSSEALATVAENSPNIVFADVSLIATHRNALMKIGQKSTMIYISKDKSQTFEAFETLGFDYLTLPLAYERFEMSMHKFTRLSLLAPMPSFRKTEAISDSFFVKSDARGQKEMKVRCSEIIFIEALQNYVAIHMMDDRKLISHNTMKEMEECLPEGEFIRVHKSFIINYARVTSIEGNNIVLNENEKYSVQIGGTYKKPFLERKNQKMIRKKSGLHTFQYSITASVCLVYGSALLGCREALELISLSLI